MEKYSNMKIEHFVELGAPETGLFGLGWYTSVSRDETDPNNNVYYSLHHDDNVYDFCYDIVYSPSTGWFKTKEDCVAAVTAYYKKYGLVYPYARAEGIIKSELMEFE